MISDYHHDKLVAKIQYFADCLSQIHEDKENLMMALCDEKKMIRETEIEIKTYREIIDMYYTSFGEILYVSDVYEKN